MEEFFPLFTPSPEELRERVSGRLSTVSFHTNLTPRLKDIVFCDVAERLRLPLSVLWLPFW